ncbi:MAG: CoA pyrophosphatase [Chloroflexi bacterium]|nr:CoA pyrophosphatase [Chloroflexota bacterium]
MSKTGAKTYNFRESTLENIKHILRGREKRIVSNLKLSPAAVLVPVYKKEGEYYLIFTRRTKELEHHKGEISFPGGVYSEGDGTLLETALRETCEEMGVIRKDVEILGELDDMPTNSGFRISPYVAAFPYPCSFAVNPNEIEEVLEVPVLALLDKSNVKEGSKDVLGAVMPTYFFEYKGNVIFGATARILKQFLDLAFGSQGARI